MNVKQRTCKAKGCSNKFYLFNSLQTSCSIKCALELAVRSRKYQERKDGAALKRIAKADKAKIRKAREGLMTRSQHLNLTEKAFRRFIRARDRLFFIKQGRLPECVSCGTTNQSIQYAAGHLKTKGGFPELRLDESNCFLQCNRQCNEQKSGNINGDQHSRGYLVGLIEIYGDTRAAEIIEYVNSYHPPKKWTIEQLIEMKEDFNLRALNFEKEIKLLC